MVEAIENNAIHCHWYKDPQKKSEIINSPEEHNALTL